MCLGGATPSASFYPWPVEKKECLTVVYLRSDASSRLVNTTCKRIETVLPRTEARLEDGFSLHVIHFTAGACTGPSLSVGAKVRGGPDRTSPAQRPILACSVLPNS